MTEARYFAGLDDASSMMDCVEGLGRELGLALPGPRRSSSPRAGAVAEAKTGFPQWAGELSFWLCAAEKTGRRSRAASICLEEVGAVPQKKPA